MFLSKGREAIVYLTDGWLVTWYPKSPDAHPEHVIGWELCKTRLSPPHFPDVYFVSDRQVNMGFVPGEPPATWNEAQATTILDSLKAANIMHRDIRIDNIIVRPTGHWCLIDFGWACDLNNPYPAPRQVGGRYRGPDGPDDAYAMEVVKSLLTQSANLT